jgi:hypothetical protein
MTDVKIHTYGVFCENVVHALIENDDWRNGQGAYNVLDNMRPDLSRQILGGSIDPFYDDSRLDGFSEWVSEHWNDD